MGHVRLLSIQPLCVAHGLVHLATAIVQGVRCIPRPLSDTGFTHGIDLQLQLATLSHAEMLHLVQG